MRGGRRDTGGQVILGREGEDDNRDVWACGTYAARAREGTRRKEHTYSYIDDAEGSRARRRCSSPRVPPPPSSTSARIWQDG